MSVSKANGTIWWSFASIVDVSYSVLSYSESAIASETGSDYHPIFFAQDRLLEELFCICIQLVNKTWKEMRATQEDFDKV